MIKTDSKVGRLIKVVNYAVVLAAVVMAVGGLATLFFTGDSQGPLGLAILGVLMLVLLLIANYVNSGKVALFWKGA